MYAVFAAIVVGLAAVIVSKQHAIAEHEKFMHLAWYAAYYNNRAEADSISVWATHYESGNGCQYRRLWVRLPGRGRPTILSSRTVNMWGYSQYGWEDWSKANEDIMTTLRAYVVDMDEKTSKYATSWANTMEL